MRSFVKIKPLRNGRITLSFIDIGKSCLSREFFTSLICLLMLFAKKNLAKISESTVIFILGLLLVKHYNALLSFIVIPQ